jgi:acyl-CoA synthetase (AMP-forming)/AMP-acid ligase II/aryl carrier-like protein
VGLSKTVQHLQHGPEGKKAGSRIFRHLGDLLAYYGRTAPGRNAILAPGRPALTYGALRVCAKRVARVLRSLGVAQSDRVAVVLPDGPEAAVAIIAVASAAVCVPLNPSFTADEWKRYFADLRVSALLTYAGMDTASRTVANAVGIPVIDLLPRPGDGPGAFSLVGAATGQVVGGEKSNPYDAFILLTSGTSSRPKMVPLTHAAVCLSAYNVGAAVALGSQDRLLNVLPLFHGHGLISGLVAALAAGSSVVCPPGFDAAAFFGWLTEFRPTWYTAVPAIHRALLSAAARHKHCASRSSLRLIRSASSTLPPELLDSLEALFGVPVIDTYGMTEATTQIAANPLGRRKPGSVGQAAGPEIAIFDGESRRLPAGERGEIALRGPTITRGYDNDAAATASAFRDGWFRTGDLGYLDEDGYLFIVGRLKDIIDRGGQKVAPAEVERALLNHPDVVEAAVFSVPHTRLGADVAAAVVLHQHAQVSEDSLRDFARERLASFKVPGLIRIVPEIPKGPAGKIKRDELLSALSITLPTARVESGGKLAPPRSQLERKLADTWTELLELDQIGVDENVFALGADSITVTQMLSRLRARFGVDFSFQDIFDAPTVAALAARLGSSQKDSAPVSPSLYDSSTDITHAEGDGPPQMSILQEHALRIEREFPGLPQFNLPFAYRLQGPLNVSALERSLAEVVRRHDSLRTGFTWLEEVSVALMTRAGDINPLLVVEDLAPWAPTGDNQVEALLLKKAELQAEQETLTPFDMSRPPLLRTRLSRLGPNDHVLLLILHDMIADGWSMGIFMEEISEAYAAFAAGRPAQLPEPALQFSDFARWQRQWSTSDAARRQFAFWKERLRGASPLFAANDDIGDALLAAHIAQEPVHLSTDLVARLTALSHSQGATLFMTLLAGFKTLLLARSGRNDICVATAMANRSQPRTERMIGPVGNASLIRTWLDADLSFQEALRRVRDSVLETYARQELPFDILAARLAQEDDLDPTSLMQVFFVLQNAFRRPLKLPGVAVRPFAYREGQQGMPIDRTWLRVTLRETPSGITGTCRYKADLFEPNTLQHWVADYKTILAKAAANPETSLGGLIQVILGLIIFSIGLTFHVISSA